MTAPILRNLQGEPKSFSGSMLNGVTRFLNAYKDKINDTVFKEKLGEVSIKELTKIAKERRAGSLGYAEAILIYYNKRLKNALSWGDLYKSKAEKKRYKKSQTAETAASKSKQEPEEAR